MYSFLFECFTSIIHLFSFSQYLRISSLLYFLIASCLLHSAFTLLLCFAVTNGSDQLSHAVHYALQWLLEPINSQAGLAGFIQETIEKCCSAYVISVDFMQG